MTGVNPVIVILMSDWLVRYRVALGWIAGLAAIYVSRPTLSSLLAGLGVAALGECLRLWAAGHLRKFESLTQSGPYAWTRNPLYLGSALVGLGFTVATGRPLLVALWVGMFAGVYFSVMRTEARKLAGEYPDAYPQYARSVPLFWPRWPSPGEEGAFSWGRLRRNREHQTALGAIIVAGLLAMRYWIGG